MTQPLELTPRKPDDYAAHSRVLSEWHTSNQDVETYLLAETGRRLSVRDMDLLV